MLVVLSIGKADSAGQVPNEEVPLPTAAARLRESRSQVLTEGSDREVSAMTEGWGEERPGTSGDES